MQGIMLLSKLVIHVIDMFYSCMLLLYSMIRLLCSNHICCYYSCIRYRAAFKCGRWSQILFERSPDQTCIIHVYFCYVQSCTTVLIKRSSSVLMSTDTVLIFGVSFYYQVFNSVLNQNNSTYGYYLFICVCFVLSITHVHM